MTGFTEAMVPEIVQPFWAAMQRGEFITDAAGMAGTYRKKGARWIAAAGGCASGTGAGRTAAAAADVLSPNATRPAKVPVKA